MPNMCLKMIVARGLSLVPVAHQGFLYEVFEDPTLVNHCEYPRLLLHGAVHQVIDHVYNRYANASTQEFLSYQEWLIATGTRLGPYESYHICALFGH